MSFPVPDQITVKPRRRWWKRALIGLLLALLIPTAIYRYKAWRLDRELDEVMAELDQREPGWRLEDLEKNRKTIAKEKNGAFVVTAATRMMPRDWHTNPIWDPIGEQPPAVRFSAQRVDQMRAELKVVGPALEEAHKLTRCPTGRFPIRYAPNLFGTEIGAQQEVRSVAHLLNCEAHVLAEEGRADRAWLSCQAIVHAGDTLADEPLLITQLMRTAIHSIAIAVMERTLAMGEASQETLVEARNLFDRLSRENLFLIGMRGERGGAHLLMTNLLDGSAQLAELAGSGRQQASAWDRLSQRFAGNMIREAHIYTLRHLTLAVAAAQFPNADQARILGNLDLEFKDAVVRGKVPELARLMLPDFRRVAEADKRRRTHLACTCVALAAEEYRLKHRRWPDSAAQLVTAGLLKEVPTDLYDGQPLRWRPTADGLAIYSIGWSGKYRGDSLDNNQPLGSEVIRVEFRLWDPERRAQPSTAAGERKLRED